MLVERPADASPQTAPDLLLDALARSVGAEGFRTRIEPDGIDV